MATNKRKPVPKPGAKPGRRAQSGRGLTRERIVHAAMTLVDKEGEAGLSMRRLGSALGVEAMALYNHFDNREAILDAVADGLFGQMTLPGPGAGWRGAILGLALEFRALALRSPNRFRVAMERPTKPARALPLMERVMGALAEAGASPARRLQVYHTLVAFIRGFLMWEMDVRSGRCGLELPPEMVEGFPNVRAVARAAGQAELDRLFEGGVGVILDGGVG